MRVFRWLKPLKMHNESEGAQLGVLRWDSDLFTGKMHHRPIMIFF